MDAQNKAMKSKIKKCAARQHAKPPRSVWSATRHVHIHRACLGPRAPPRTAPDTTAPRVG
jgi:hypothetical protein